MTAPKTTRTKPTILDLITATLRRCPEGLTAEAIGLRQGLSTTQVSRTCSLHRGLFELSQASANAAGVWRLMGEGEGVTG